ncbi:MAG: ABC transporter ATP-binding protein [Nitrospiraceae bacterium]
MAELEVRSISKVFGAVQVLQDISLRVADGQFTILLGPSGCGKSTLLRIIAGLETQTQGEVRIGGLTVDHLSPRDRDIAMVFQQYALYPHLTVRENLAFGLKMRKEPTHVIHSRIQEAAQLLDIDDLLNRKPRELSGGQRQRVAMGRAIVRKPKLFLFDEPLSNLDARLRASMRIELKKLHRRLGATMMYVTHDQVEAMTLGDTIVVLDRGRIRQADSPARIYSRPADPFVAGFIGSPGMNLLEGTLAPDGNARLFRCGTLTVSLPSMVPISPDPRSSTAVLGIRPEDILLHPSGSPDACLKGEVDVVEDLGPDQVLHLEVADRRMVVRVPQGEQYDPGASVNLYLPHNRLHLFVDEARVDWMDHPIRA